MKTIAILSAAALLGMAFAGTAGAQSAVRDTAFQGEAGNVVGGGAWLILGGGDDMTIVAPDRGAGMGSLIAPHLAGWAARIGHSDGDGPQVTRTGLAPQAADRVARMQGGGDDREILY